MVVNSRVSTRPTWAEVSLANLAHNFRVVQEHVGSSLVCAVPELHQTDIIQTKYRNPACLCCQNDRSCGLPQTFVKGKVAELLQLQAKIECFVTASRLPQAPGERKGAATHICFDNLDCDAN